MMDGWFRKIIVHALEYEEFLSEWESEFVNDIANKDEKTSNFHLSDKQKHQLNKISEKLGRI